MTTQEHKKIAHALAHDIDANVPIASIARILFGLPKKDQSKVIAILKDILFAKEGIVEASVISAKALDTNDKETLVASIKTRMHADHVELKEKIDPALIGGFRLQIKDSVFDSSLKYKLHQLQTHIANS